MSVLIIDRPATHDSNAAGPMAGPWEIGSGQRVGLTTRSFRTRELPARVLGGAFVVTDDLVGSSLDFTIEVSDPICSAVFSARVTRILSVDSWQADGIGTTDSGSRPVSIHLRSNGVFRQRGRQDSLWLSARATIDLAELRPFLGNRHAGRIRLAAELNLNPGLSRRSSSGGGSVAALPGADAGLVALGVGKNPERRGS